MNGNRDRSYETAFASVYDQFMQDAPYEKWFDWLNQQIPNLSHQVVADLGCGTGRFTLKLATVCQHVIGIDLSEEMLSQAASLAQERRLSAQWLCQDMRDLHLPTLVDGIVSTSDSLNYLLTEEDLLRAFLQVFANLRPGGWFYFDLIGWERAVALRDGFSYELQPEAAVLFESDLSEQGRISYELHAFIANGGSCYKRVTEHHSQQYFDSEVTTRCLLQAGFEVVEFMGDFTGNELETAQRYVVKARKSV